MYDKIELYRLLLNCYSTPVIIIVLIFIGSVDITHPIICHTPEQILGLNKAT